MLDHLPDAMGTVTTRSLPAISIVMEWENVTRTGDHRAEAMVESVTRQIAKLGNRFQRRPELVAVFDADRIGRETVEAILRRHIHPASDVALILAPVHGLDYFDQKNHGGRVASGDWVILVDCDIIPAEGWLSALLSAAQAKGNRVLIAGNTCIDTTDVTGRAFSCFWYFPLPDWSSGVVPIDYFLANNLIVPRAVFLEHPFVRSRSIIGRAGSMAASLTAAGIPLFRAQSARAVHPAPKSWRGLMRRALTEGHDACVDPLNQPHRARIAIRWAPRLLRNLARVPSRVLRNRRAAGIAWTELPTATLIGIVYYLFVAAGEIAALAEPEHPASPTGR